MCIRDRQSSISASSRESCPGVRWNIISTDGDPKVQLPRLWMLTACGSLQDKVESKLWETAAPALVQGNMDLLCKGACDETYLKLVNSTAEDCASYYDENMTLQAQAFMNVFDVNDLDGTQTDRFADIMKQVYALSLIHI